MKKTALSVLWFLFLSACVQLEPFTVPQVYLNNGDLMMNIQAEASAVSALSISPDGRYLITVDNGGTLTASDFGIVRMWDLVEGRQIFKATNTLKLAKAVAISPDGRYAVTGGETRPFLNNRGQAYKAQEQEQYGLNVWDLSTGTIIRKFAGFKGPGMDVCDIRFSRDGRYFLASSYQQIYVFDAQRWKAIRKFPVNKWCVSAAFSPDGKTIITGDGDGVFHLWDIETAKKIWTIRGHKSGILGKGDATGIAFSPDGKTVLTSSGYEGTVRVWDAATGRVVREFTGFKIAEYGVSGVNGLALSPDGTQVLVLARPMKVVDVKTGKELADLSAAWKGQTAVYTGNALSGAYLPDNRRVILNLSDATVRMYDTRTGEELAMFVGFSDGEWLVITREGYYNASEKGAQYLRVIAGNQAYGVDKFYDVFYRPDIIAARLRGDDIRGLVTITMKDAIKNPPPDVAFTSEVTDTGQARVRICYQVKSTGGGIGEVRLFHNGKLIQSDGYYKEIVRSSVNPVQLAALDSRAIYKDIRGIAVKEGTESAPTTSKPKGEVFEDCREVDVIPGENEISVAAFNGSNTVQSYMETIRFNSSLKPEAAHLYILAIGLNQYEDGSVTLNYAVKDARDIGEKIRIQAATLYNPRNIHATFLSDREATKANILGRMDALAKVMKPQDSFILFVAGHGVLLQNQYYLLTHDYDGRISESSVISSNEIVDMSKKVKPLSQLFIFDTCHSGGVDTIVGGLYDARMSVLAKKMGLHIFASANAMQAALDGYRGNGLFTYTLLDGLNNNRQADKYQDGQVSIVGLGEYSRQMTWTISKQIGHEQTPLIINFGKDSPIYKLQ